MKKILVEIFLIFFTLNLINCAKSNAHLRVHRQRSHDYKPSNSLVSQSSSSFVYRYEPIFLLEEPPIGTLIIDLASKLGINLDTSDYKFRFYSPQSAIANFFLIDQLTGHVKTQRTIDREYLCETKICGDCLTSNCTLTLEIVALLQPNTHTNVNNGNKNNSNLPKQKFVSFDVIVEDKNEFAPQFSQPMITINVSEAAPNNFQIPIEAAIDRDSRQTQINYSLAPLISPKQNNENNNEGEDTNMYDNEMKKLNSKIKLLKSPFGNQLNLILIEPFDYEKEKEYSFKIVASDNGWPILTGTCLVKLQIIDVNDNLPEFEKQEYEYRIDEGVQPGTRLVHVHATDKDDGLNGLVKYSFAEQPLPSLFSSSAASSSSSSLINNQNSIDPNIPLFVIDENTGWISANAFLDHEFQSTYRLVVKAQDQGTNSMPVYASVTIYLNDLNDNAPMINVTVPEDLYKYENNCLFISEWTLQGTFLAQIMVTDADSGLNGKVSVGLQEVDKITNELIESKVFKLEHLFNNIYSLVLNDVIDRESKSEYHLIIKAHDYGTPILNTIKSLKVIILDENDNKPRFIYSSNNSTFYSYSIVEANTSSISNTDDFNKWFHLGQINCIDDDIDENGRITYKLLDVTDNKTINTNNEDISDIEDDDIKNQQINLFKINSLNGYLYVLNNLIDREAKDFYEFRLVCEDNGQKQKLSSETLLKIKVLDINDNKPEFKQTIYTYNLYEDFNLYDKILKLYAIDIDEPMTVNSTVNYKILTVFGENKTISLNSDNDINKTNLFNLNKHNGDLYLIKPFDYETNKFFKISIIAYDLGVPQQISEVITININVLDVNDNKPTLEWPIDYDLPLIYNLNDLYDIYLKANQIELFTIKAIDLDRTIENSKLNFIIEKQQKLNFNYANSNGKFSAYNGNDDTFATNIHLFDCDVSSGTLTALFLKRLKSITTSKIPSTSAIDGVTASNYEIDKSLIGIYYIEIKISDSAKSNPLSIHAQLFVVLNTNTSQLNHEIKLIKRYLNQTSLNFSNNTNVTNSEKKVLNLKKYVYNANLLSKMKTNKHYDSVNTFDISTNDNYADFINELDSYGQNGDGSDSEVDLLDSNFLFLTNLFNINNSKANKFIENIFGKSYKFILLLITFVIIIVLFVITSIFVVICYRRQRLVYKHTKKNRILNASDDSNSLNRQKIINKMTYSSDSGTNSTATLTKSHHNREQNSININDNLLSSLIDIPSTSSSIDATATDNMLTTCKLNNLNQNTQACKRQQQVISSKQMTATLNRPNKLTSATVIANDYDLNINAEDQAALLLYSNSPASSLTSTSTGSHRKAANGSNNSCSNTSTNQTTVSSTSNGRVMVTLKKNQHINNSIDNILQQFHTQQRRLSNNQVANQNNNNNNATLSLRTFKNVTSASSSASLATSQQQQQQQMKNNYNSHSDVEEMYSRAQACKPIYSDDAHKYRTLPINRNIYTEPVNSTVTLNNRKNPNNNNNNNINMKPSNVIYYSPNINRLQVATTIEESNETIHSLNNNQNFNNNENTNINPNSHVTSFDRKKINVQQQRDDYFFKNEKEIKKFVDKNNVIEYKHLVLNDDID